jgi:hypothetical protein
MRLRKPYGALLQARVCFGFASNQIEALYKLLYPE